MFKKILLFFNLYKNYFRFVKKKNIRFLIFVNPFFLLFLGPLLVFISKINYKPLSFYLLKHNILQFGMRFLNLKNILDIQNSKYYNEQIFYTKYKKNLDQLKKDGYTRFKGFFCSADKDNFLKILNNKEAYNAQTLLQSNGKKILFNKTYLSKKESASSYLLFLPEVSLRYKKLNNFFFLKSFLNFLNAYLGFEGSFYNVSTRVNKPSKKKLVVHNFHRDYDDFKQLAISVCWSDVTKDNGSTMYIPGSHVNPKLSLKNRKPKILSLKAGDVIVSDVLALHSANQLKQGYRLITWCKYGKKNNAATVVDGNLSCPKF